MSDNTDRPARVLVVEDDLELVRLVQRVLEEEGYHVTLASGVAEALGLLGEQGFGLVVTNLFPGPGQEALESIAGLVAAAAAIPVGVVTAWVVEEEAARAAGVAFVVRKPFDLEALEQAVEQALTRRGRE